MDTEKEEVKIINRSVSFKELGSVIRRESFSLVKTTTTTTTKYGQSFIELLKTAKEKGQ